MSNRQASGRRQETIEESDSSGIEGRKGEKKKRKVNGRAGRGGATKSRGDRGVAALSGRPQDLVLASSLWAGQPMHQCLLLMGKKCT